MKIHTQLVACTPDPDDPYRPTNVPIYQTATFGQPSAVECGRYDYARSGNPTREALEVQVAALEGGTRAFAFASGLAALTAVARRLAPGDEVLAHEDLYGGTHRLFSRILSRSGITVRYADLTDLEAAAAAFGPRTRLVHAESLSNPRLQVCDVRRLAALAHGRGALLSVDSSALSPYLHRPLSLGADFVVHSATKYLCGHSDVTAGLVVVADPDLAEDLYLVQNGEGAVLGPFDAFLLLRGLKTLAVRLDRQQATASRLAAWLQAHPAVRRVHFPGLPGHPGAALHATQASGPGALLSFETGSLDVSRRIVEGLRLFTISVSFGSLSSTVSLPCRMSHASIPAEARQALSLPEDLVRVSVGLEDEGDLRDDLERALGAVLHKSSSAGQTREISVP
jgi:cysteine-S-conjugate beta-lyase